MDRSWLVQRLGKPHGVDNPFSFGGGLKNGGLSDDAMGLLRGIFSFDYMGAAEFEFGAVPKAFRKIAEQADAGKLSAFVFDVDVSTIEPDFRDKRANIEPETFRSVYVIARDEDRAEVTERIRGWATERYNNLKETTRLASTLRPFHEWDGDVVGWLELNNGFMFFTDKDMWEKTAELFGVET